MNTENATKEATEEINLFLKQLQDHGPYLLELGIKVIISLVVFVIGRFVINWFRKLLKHAMSRSNIDTGVAQFIDSFIKAALYALLIFSIATNLGVDTASVAAVIASAGVAIGLALQGSLSNFAGGVLILILKPFVVGDYIIEDSCKNEGTVTEIQLFYTKLTTIDNKTIIIPNGTLANNSLTNATQMEERRLDLKIGISYDSNLKRAKALLETIMQEETEIIKEKEVNVFVSELGESAVILGIRAWVKNEEFWTVKWRLLEKIKLTFDQEGVEIPYQQIMIHTKKVES